MCWNLLFLKQQVENLWFYAKQSEKKLWNQQKVSQKVKLAETAHTKKETRDKKFKKAIPVAEMFTSKTISMRLNLNFWIIFIGNSAVDCHALFSKNRPIIIWFIFEEKLYFRHFSMISGWNGLFQSINRNFLPYQKARGKTVQRGINRSPPSP